MNIIAALFLLLFFIITISYFIVSWFLGGMGGHKLWDSLLDIFPDYVQFGGPVLALATIAQIIHQRKRGKMFWPLLLVLAVIVAGIGWRANDMMIKAAQLRESAKKYEQRVTEEVLWSSESIQAFEEYGIIMKKSRSFGKRNTAPKVVNIHMYSPEVTRMPGLYGHPFMVYENGFELLTIVFQLTDKAPPVDLTKLRVYEFNPDRPSDPKKQVPILPKVDQAARTITIELKHHGSFGLFDPSKMIAP